MRTAIFMHFKCYLKPSGRKKNTQFRLRSNWADESSQECIKASQHIRCKMTAAESNCPLHYKTMVATNYASLMMTQSPKCHRTHLPQQNFRRKSHQDTSLPDPVKGNDINQFGERNRRMRKICLESRLWRITEKGFWMSRAAWISRTW